VSWQGYPVAVVTPRRTFELRSDLDHGRMVASCRHPEGLEFRPANAGPEVRACAGCLTLALAGPVMRGRTW